MRCVALQAYLPQSRIIHGQIFENGRLTVLFLYFPPYLSEMRDSGLLYLYLYLHLLLTAC